jgi:hypothetical protein
MNYNFESISDQQIAETVHNFDIFPAAAYNEEIKRPGLVQAFRTEFYRRGLRMSQLLTPEQLAAPVVHEELSEEKVTLTLGGKFAAIYYGTPKAVLQDRARQERLHREAFQEAV